MKPKSLLLLAALFICPLRLNAMTYPCNCATIEGLVPAHQKGTSVLGPSTVSVPEKMSVYVSVTTWHGVKTLYLLSNLKPADKKHPTNLMTTDYVDFSKLIYMLGDPHSRSPFNRSAITYYVEPSFFTDPDWGYQRDQLIGTVCVLGPDGKVQGRYVQKDPEEKSVPELNSPAPAGWAQVIQGVVQTPGLSVPAEFLEKSKQPHVQLVAVGPGGLNGRDMPSLTLESSSQDVVPGHILSLTALKNIDEDKTQNCNCQVAESKAFMVNGKPVVRTIQVQKGGNGQPDVYSIVYYFQHGWELYTFTGTCSQDQYVKYGALFQEAFQRMVGPPTSTKL
jgi:hypothetical protein